MGALVYNRPSFLKKIRNRSHAVIEASAGTGKTFAIEHLIVDLLLSGAYAVDQILVVTFTEKATAELRVRIRQALEKILFGVPNPDPAGKTEAVIIDEQARKRLEDAFHAFDRAPIFTIHGFCHRVLTDFAFQSGMLMDLQLTDRSGAFHQAFRDELRERLAADSVAKPLLEAWLTGTDAEDGKGKTPDELEKLLLEAYWRRYLDSPDTGARKQAARRLMDIHDKKFLERALRHSGLSGEPLDNAFESIERLERAIEQADRDPEKLLEEAGTIDFGALTAPILKAKRGVTFSARAGALAADLQAAAAVAQCREWKLVDLFLPPIARRMDRDKREHGLIDYDDMLAWVWRALEAPGGAALAASLRARLRCALVDEFQDTDDLQWQIFRRLFVEGEAGNRLYVVGDPKQAIYSFRGADIYTYLKARGELISRGAAQMPLLDNFRSTSDLIDACNHIFDQRAPNKIFNDPIKYDNPVRCGRPDRRALDNASKPITPVILMRYKRADGEKAPVSEVRRAIGQHMAAELHRMLHQEGSRIRIEENGAKPRYVNAKDIYVLTRTKVESAEAGEYLREAGVPFAFYKQEGLFQTSEAYYILDILRAVAEPHVRSRRLKAWLSPFFAVPLRDVALIEEVPSAHPLNERLYEWKEIAERGQFAELFDRLLHQSGLVNRELFLTGNERRLTNYQHILEILLSAALTRRIGLAEITALLEDYINERAMPDIEEGNLQRLESEREAVSVITVHMSKGLEADVVVLFGGFGRITDQPPVVVYHDDDRQRRFAIGKKARDQIRDKLKQEQQDEDRRLLYVGLTRARARLYVPLLPENSTKMGVHGYYEALNDRLLAIEAGLGKRGASKLFSVQNVATPDGATDRSNSSDLIKVWTPPAALLDMEPSYSEGSFWNLRRTHGPLIMRSYTALQGAREEQGWDIPAEEFKRDMETSAAEPDLPGGREAGIFLHEVIERLAMDSIAQSSGLGNWRGREDVKALFYSAMRRNQVKNQTAWFERGTQMVYEALTVPIAISGGRTVGPLYRCASVREMEFVYPIPESSHPLLAKGAAQGQWIVERGYLKGFVDFIFEHEGLVYFADWKSDHLSSYEPGAIQKHVKLHYEIQAQIYSIGIIRLLQIHSEDDYERRFGGLLYIFLRGIEGGGQHGVYFHRPAWTEICAYEAELMRMETEPAPDRE